MGFRFGILIRCPHQSLAFALVKPLFGLWGITGLGSTQHAGAREMFAALASFGGRFLRYRPVLGYFWKRLPCTRDGTKGAGEG
jgi:hypothetical protein